MDIKDHLNAAIPLPEQKLKGKYLLPENEGYEQARAVWNGAAGQRPAIIVLPEDVDDVVAAVKFAAENNLPLSVRGGGHDWAGRALNSNGVLINMRTMNSVTVDQKEKTAVVEGGTTAKELVLAVEPHGLIAVTGTVGAVGFTGLTLGGGYGPLSPSLGLAIDNLISAELVLADGSVVTVSETDNPELFWAIRGGGGNFGVVTSMKVRLHQTKPLLSGMILFQWADAPAVFGGLNRLIETAPDELSVLSGMIPGPDGSPMMFIVPIYFGDPSDGEKYVSSLQQLGTPIMAQVGLMQFSDFLGLFDPHIADGRHYALQTRWLPELDDDSIAAIIKGAVERSSPLSAINIHHFHGAASRVPVQNTAFGLRKTHYMLEIIAAWDPSDAANGHLHQQWARELSNALAKNAYPGGYPNILGPEETEQINHAYGDNRDRLQKAKQFYDAGNVFNGIGIPAN